MTHLLENLENTVRNIIITKADGTIIECNDAWLKTCGYKREEVINRTNSILQGPLTESDKVREINAATRGGRGIYIDITNHKKDGMPFRNRLTITPHGEYFIAEVEDKGPSDYELLYRKRMVGLGRKRFPRREILAV